MSFLRLVVFVMLVACRDVLGPHIPRGAIRFAPDTTGVNNYRWQWQRMERCSGITADFHRVEWFYYPGVVTIVRHGGDTVRGFWNRPHRIYLPELDLEGVFASSHEMLHDLLNLPASVKNQHPAKYFIEKCGYELFVPHAKPRFPDLPF